MSVGAAAAVLRREGIGSVVVSDGDDALDGIVTESDVVRGVGADHDLDRMTVARLMTEEVVTIGPEATLQTVCDRMTEHDVERLPVVDGTPQGIVTTTDLARALSQDLDDVLAAFR